MQRKKRLRMQQQLKTFATEDLLRFISKAIVVMFRDPSRIKQIGREYHLLKREMGIRGFIVDRFFTPFGMGLGIIPNDTIQLAIPDHRAMGPVTMLIPSVDTILSFPLPTDLPQHGYLTHS